MTVTPKLILTGQSGGKGGGGGRAPVEHANDLFSVAKARVIDLLGEGEIFGLVDRTNIMKSIYLDDVPLQNSDGSFNFEGVVVQERVGSPDQSVVTGFSEVEASVSLNSQQVTDVSSPQWSISDEDLDAIRVILRLPSLYTQNTSNGDLLRHTVGFKIEVQEADAGGVWDTLLNETITGKTNSPYERAYRIGLNSYTESNYPLLFRVVRTTPESEATTTQDQLFVDSYVEILEARLTYPDSAYVAMTVDSEQFGDRVPKRTYLVKGLKIKHPSNYDPETREYTGLWDGTFTEGYCNNPAWVLYDLLTNSRYGLGDDIAPEQVDKAALYQIARYCDELVDDGRGGLEPRFEFNGVIEERKEAYVVVNAIATAFRGMVFWSSGGVSFSHDAPKDVTRLVGPANVLGGNFEYSGVGLKARHSVVAVLWNDPDDSYKQTIKVVEDPELIQRFGWRPLELQAVGCTSPGLATRLGKWALESEKSEAETVTFTAGWDHANVRPGDVLQISDPTRVGSRLQGRVLAANVKSLLPETVTGTFAAETNIAFVTTTPSTGEAKRDEDAAFACTLRIPPGVIPEGTIFEAGSATTSATWLGFNGDGTLILRAGDGAYSPVAADVARLEVDESLLPRGRDIDIYWDIRINPGRVRLWINSQYMGESGTSDFSALKDNEWSSSGDGGYGKTTGSKVAGETGNYTQRVQDSGVVLKTPLSYYRDDFIWTPNYPAAASETTTRFLPDPDGEILSSGVETPGGVDRNANAMFWWSFRTPTAGTSPEGCMFELGKGPAAGTNVEALYVGFDGNGDFVFHAGASGADQEVTGYARIVVPASYWQPVTSYHLTLTVMPNEGTIRLHINHRFYAEATTSTRGPFQNGQFAQGESGAFGGVFGQTIEDLPAGATNDFNGTLISPLEYARLLVLAESNNGLYAGDVTLDQSWSVTPGDQLLVQVGDGGVDVLDLFENSTGTVVHILQHPSKAILPNAVYVLKSTVEPEEWRVLSNREVDTHQYEIASLRYDRRKFALVEQGIRVPAPATTLLPTGPLLAPTGLSIRESLYKVNKSTFTRLDLSWTPSTDPRVRFYRVEARSPQGNWETFGTSSIPNYTFPSAQTGVWDFRVTSITDNSQTGHLSARAELLNHTVVGKSAPPTNVSGLVAVRSYVAATLKWNPVQDIDLVGYEIRQGATYDSGDIVASMHVSTQIVIPFETTAPVTFHVRAIDELGLLSPTAASVTTSPPALSEVSNFVVYQQGTGVRSTWDALELASTVAYELRYGPVSGSFDEASTLDETTATQIVSTITVATSQTYRFYVKPYVKLESGNRVYGPASSFDKELHPRIGTNLVKTQAEHPTWSGWEVAQAPSRTADEVFEPDDLIDATVSWAPSGIKRMARKQSGTFRVTLSVDSSGGTPVGSIWEMGNAGRGAYLGFDGNGDLIFRAGDDTNVNDRARLVVDNADIPLDREFTILCDIRVGVSTPLRVRLWIDGKPAGVGGTAEIGVDQTNNGSAPDSWANNADGRYRGSNGDIVAGETGAYSQNPEISSVTLESDLDYWADTLVVQNLEVTVSDELALKADSVFGAYRYTFTLSSEQFVRLWYQASPVFLALSGTPIFDLTGVAINDVPGPITPVTNTGGTPNIKLFLEFATEIPFQQADFKCTSVTVRGELRRNLTDDFRPALAALTTYADLQSNMT
jgi:predicted phage tail protein